jgi:hypothetical protein
MLSGEKAGRCFNKDGETCRDGVGYGAEFREAANLSQAWLAIFF